MKKIQYDPDRGLVSIDITPKYATLGKYSLFYYENGSFTEIDPTSARNLGDSVPDVHILKKLTENPGRHYVSVRGNFMPAPNHQQVNVVYTFRQDPHPEDETDDEVTVLDTVEVKDTVQGRSFQSYSNRFRFEPTSDGSGD